MKKAFLAAIICAITTTSPLFGQAHTQSLSFTGPSAIDITTTNTFTLSVSLTFSGYMPIGLSYWLEVQNALAPFLTITGLSYFTFPVPNSTGFPCSFNSTAGASSGYMVAPCDLGASTEKLMLPLPGTYHITDIIFMLAPGTPLGMYDLRSTTHSPRISEVTDTDFNDNNIVPAGTFTINIVPEPSTLALLILAAAGSGLMEYRRCKSARWKTVLLAAL